MLFLPQNRKKGFTLVELLVTIAIMGIALAAIGSIFVMGTNIFKKTTVRYNEQSIALNLTQQVRRSVQNCASLTVYDGSSSDTSSQDGTHLYYNAADGGLDMVNSGTTQTFKPDTAGGCSVTLSFRKVTSATLEVTVKASEQGDSADVYTLTSDIVLGNFSGSAGGIADQTTSADHTGGMVVYEAYEPPV